MNNIAKREIALANGEVISIGVNFYALQLMTKYPGGLKKLRRDMEQMVANSDSDEEESDTFDIALDAMAHLLWSVIRGGGRPCTKEEVMMMLGPDDFRTVHEIFTEFSEAMTRMANTMPKNA